MPSNSRQADIDSPLLGSSSSGFSKWGKVLTGTSILALAIGIASLSINLSEGTDLSGMQKSISAMKQENESLRSQLVSINQTLAAMKYVADTTQIKSDIDALRTKTALQDSQLSSLRSSIGDAAVPIDCSSTLRDIDTMLTSDGLITIKCAKGCVRSDSVMVWGSNDDGHGYMGGASSSVCLAATHAGVVNPAVGGIAIITKAAGQALYHGSSGSFGVISDNGSVCASSFKVSTPVMQQIVDLQSAQDAASSMVADARTNIANIFASAAFKGKQVCRDQYSNSFTGDDLAHHADWNSEIACNDNEYMSYTFMEPLHQADDSWLFRRHYRCCHFA
jgi:hypothetical protein